MIPDEIYKYFNEAIKTEQKESIREWVIDRLIDVAAMGMIVLAVVMIMLSIAG